MCCFVFILVINYLDIRDDVVGCFSGCSLFPLDGCIRISICGLVKLCLAILSLLNVIVSILTVHEKDCGRMV